VYPVIALRVPTFFLKKISGFSRFPLFSPASAAILMIRHEEGVRYRTQVCDNAHSPARPPHDCAASPIICRLFSGNTTLPRAGWRWRSYFCCGITPALSKQVFIARQPAEARRTPPRPLTSDQSGWLTINFEANPFDTF